MPTGKILTRQLNSYFAILMITITGAWASLTIIQVAYRNTYVIVAGQPVYVDYRL